MVIYFNDFDGKGSMLENVEEIKFDNDILIATFKNYETEEIRIEYVKRIEEE